MSEDDMRKYRTESEWLDLIREQESSGENISYFSRQRGIHPNLFYKKRRELYPVTEKQTFVELKTPSFQHKTLNRSELKITIRDIDIYPGAERDMDFLSSLIKTAWEVSGASV